MHPGNRSVGLDRASKGEGRKRWRETMQVGFVSASESGGSHGGCRAEEEQAVTSSVAPCFRLLVENGLEGSGEAEKID